MKRLTLALSAVALSAGSALAADLPVRTYTKAPPPIAVAPSWNGFYAFGGFGGGVWDADNDSVDHADGIAARSQHMGGHGVFGTVGAGYDWQLAGPWVTGVFADGMFGSLNGSINDIGVAEGAEKLRTTWAVGVRAGWLVTPNVLSYVNAGYTGSEWSGASLTSVQTTGILSELTGSATTPSFHSDGWFIGGGVENSLNIFGITAPGWNMKTEYRAAYFGRTSLTANEGNTITFKPIVQTISTSLVYHFNSDCPSLGRRALLRDRI
jgi:outer membrane immunogenic protein